MSMTGAAAAHELEPVLSIGEVLNLLRPEFADVTISKLRFTDPRTIPSTAKFVEMPAIIRTERPRRRSSG